MCGARSWTAPAADAPRVAVRTTAETSRLSRVDKSRLRLAALDHAHLDLCGRAELELGIHLGGCDRLLRVMRHDVVVAHLDDSTRIDGRLPPGTVRPRNGSPLLDERLGGDQLALPLEISDVRLALLHARQMAPGCP